MLEMRGFDLAELTGGSAADKLINLLMLLMGLLGAVFLVAEYGFFMPADIEDLLHRLEFGVVCVFITLILVRGVFARRKNKYIKKYWLEFVLIGLFFLLFFAVPNLSKLEFFQDAFGMLELEPLGGYYITIVQSYIALQLVLGLARLYARFLAFIVKPTLILLISYAVLIIAGALLLMMPKSTPTTGSISIMDAVFTSISACCVTGLTVLDTGTGFTSTGHIILMGLMQLGGIGIVTFITFICFLQQRSLGLRQMVVLRDIFSYDVIGELGRFIVYVLLITFTVELLGTIALFKLIGGEQGLLWSAFHSVSAFNNAGFSLEATNLIKYADVASINAVFMLLIVAGGIGFPVFIDLLNFRVSSLPVFRRFIWLRRQREVTEISRLKIQTRLVLASTAILILLGAVFFFALEYDNTILEKDLENKTMASLFQSVTARTAGFNTVDIAALKPATLVLLIGLMIVGASPLSTGGGIKTITLVVSLAAITSMLSNRGRIEIMRRSIPVMIVRTAIAIVILYSFCAFSASFLLSVTDPSIPYLNLLFETISALSTVGLSTGITATLSTAGKLILCALMIIGRLGPLVILFSVVRQSSRLHREYPDEDIILT